LLDPEADNEMSFVIPEQIVQRTKSHARGTFLCSEYPLDF